MEMALQELPLALFTTLAPIGAGAFVALAAAFCTTEYEDAQLKKIDTLTLVPLAFVIIGLLCSVFHLTQPLNGIGIFAGLGSSPLSNEVVMAIVLILAAVIYWILAFTGKLSAGARKGFAAVVAVLAVVFAVFTGMAYMIATIPSWNTPALPVSIVGFCLLGGGLLGAMVLSCAGVLAQSAKTSFKTALIVIVVAGAVLAIGGAVAQYAGAAGITTAASNGAAMAGAVTMYVVAFVVCGLAAAFMGLYSLIKNPNTTLMVTSVVLAVVGVFIARLVFYALQISVGM